MLFANLEEYGRANFGVQQLRWGNTLVGEITLRGIILWKRYFAEVLMRGPLRISMMDSSGDNDDKLRWGYQR